MGRLGRTVACATPILLLAIATTVPAAELNLGPADALAIDQPRVTIAIEDPVTEEVLGPNIFNEALLDTGATNHTRAQAAA